MNEQYNLDNKEVLKILPFYNVSIDFVKSDAVRRFNNVELMSKLPFYKDLSVEKISEAFKRYAKNYRVEIVDKKDPMIRLYSSKVHIIELFGELLSEMKGFKYQISLFVTLKKSKLDGTVEYAAVYLNSFVKTVINYDFDDSIDKSFSEILFRLENWINEGSGWVIERANDQYLNISQYALLVGSSFIELLKELSNPKKGFECILKKCDNVEVVCDSSWSVKESEHVQYGFGYKVVCVDDRFSKDVVVYRGKDRVKKFIACILDEYEYCKRVRRDYFNKNLVMSPKEEEMFQNACSC